MPVETGQTLPSSPDSPDAGWFGHPRRLARLFTIEMWERFGFYGMRALLTLYLTKHFVLDDRAATGLYGGYTALVFLTPLIGGFLADRYLGSKRAARFGAAMMAIGYFTLAAGGAPAQPWLAFDGAHHRVEVTRFHDGPTSNAAERRFVLVDHQPLTLHGQADGSVALLDAEGHVVRSLAPQAFSEGADRSPVAMAMLLFALAMISVGNGFFKPNISTMVGALYAAGDRRRDAGFTIFYMGINLGSILGQILCPVFADWLGWWAGFVMAGVGMSIAFILICLDGGRLAGLGDTPQRALNAPGGDRAAPIVIGAVLAVPLVWWLYANLLAAHAPAAGTGLAAYLLALPLLGKLLLAAFLLGVPGILIWAWRAGSAAEFRMMAAAMVLVTFNTVFWTLFEQAGSSLTLFADRNTDRSVFGLFTLSAPQMQNVNSLAIVLLAPVVSLMWGWLAKRGWEPATPVKFALALMGVGAGFQLLVLGAHDAGPDYRVGLWWLVGLYVMHSLAELCISPVGLSMITRLSMARVVGLMMGVWFLSMAMGDYAAGAVAQIASVRTVGGAITNPKLSLETYIGLFSTIGWAAAAIGAVLLVLAPLLQRLIRDIAT